MRILPQRYFLHDDPVSIAKDLVGKYLFLGNEVDLRGGIIVETEAYSASERGCHAYGGKRTKRNEAMFAIGGRCYVYQCYGIHFLLNIVCNKSSHADAVLIRAIEPTHGVNQMQNNRGVAVPHNQLTSGPGKLTKALGIDLNWNNQPLKKGIIWIADSGIPPGNLITTTRVGIDYAGPDALLPWRFYLESSKFVSVR